MAASYIFQLLSGAHHPEYVFGLILFQTSHSAQHVKTGGKRSPRPIRSPSAQLREMVTVRTTNGGNLS